MSIWQDKNAINLKRIFKGFGIDLLEELRVPGDTPKQYPRIDLGTPDFKYGIEIKSSRVDLRSGFGLNQEKFAYGYVVCPMEITDVVIGHLYLRGFHSTGVIDTDGDTYWIVKPARFNSSSLYKNTNDIADIFMNAGDIGFLNYSKKQQDLEFLEV